MHDVFGQLLPLFARPKVQATPDMSPERRAVSDQLRNTFVETVTELGPDLCVEIGAFEAAFSQTIKARLRKSRVVAFEANPHVFEYYQPKSNGSSDVDIEYIWTAIGDSVGKVDFLIPTSIGGKPKLPACSMGSLLAYQRAPAQHETVSVPATSLDAFFGPLGDKSAAVWVDVEGAMAQVFDGGAQFFKNVLAVFCEVETRQFWSGQLIDEQVFQRFRSFGLVPALRDCERKHQYNVVLLRQEALRPRVRTAIETYLSEADRLTSDGLDA